MFPGIGSIGGLVAAAAGGGGGGEVPHTSTVTIASGEVSSNLTDFPVYVDLADMPSGFWANVASDGSDIEVTDSGGTPIPFDLVYFDHSGEDGDLYFKAPSVLSGSPNTFDINVGDGATAPAVTDPLGRNAVWSAFTRVYHGRANIDRTGAGGAATLVGDAAFINGALNLDGAGGPGLKDHAKSTLSAEPTIMSGVLLNIHFDTLASATHTGLMSVAMSGGADANRIGLMVRASAGPVQRLSVWNNTNGFLTGTAADLSAGQTISAGFDHSNGVVRNLYENGVSVGTTASAADVLTGAPVLYVGVEDETANEALDGQIVFFALKTGTILSAAEHKALYDNINAPTSFYSIA
jgi:hypothetical protein